MNRAPRTAEVHNVDISGSRISFWIFPPAGLCAPASTTAEQSKPALKSQPPQASTTALPDILMIHGFRGDHHGLLRLIEALPGHRVIVPDLPGFGFSEAMTTNTIRNYAGFVGACFEELNLARDTVLLGHSFGSIACAHFAAEHPEQFSELVLINPICEPALHGPNRIASLAAELYYTAAARLPESLGTALLRSPLIVRAMSTLLAKTGDPSLRRYIHGQHLAYFSTFTNRQALLETFRTSISTDVRQVAGHLENPVLLVAAAHDDLGSVPAQRRLAAEIEDATLCIIDGAGHLIHYENPDTAATLITAFLKERHACTL